MNHRKTDRLLELAERERLPLVMFAEGGGGRPGDTDSDLGRAALDVPSVPADRAAVGPGPAGRHRVRLLLRRQRGAGSAAAT